MYQKANSGEPDQTPHTAASDLGLHCLPMSFKKDARLIRVKMKSRADSKKVFNYQITIKLRMTYSKTIY